MQPKRIYLKDYEAPTFQIEHVNLYFDLDLETTLVTQTSKYKTLSSDELFLNGKELELVSIKIDGKDLIPPAYEKSDEGITLKKLPKNFTLEIKTKITPLKNTALEGLYASKGILSTQCEAQGFRRITYFPDRPDVLTKFTTTLRADTKKFPVLLSNGNRTKTTELTDGKTEIVWDDPSLKPCYLFALVAGDLGVLRDTFKTMNGRTVKLEIYSRHGSQNLCHHAMESLKKSMKWDEEVFGREYDLNDYMILAVDDFNAGAMENKGLNIFNSKLVFASDDVASDEDFFAIESVIAHEYFHNWTGNRITLRDWFHLSLKEGLTVFRDQEFSSDMTDRSVQRLKDVETLKLRQFSEDAGPNAHPVRPESCLSVDNFFTATIYEKGSEVIRMLSVLLGRKLFRKGMDLYFERHDGQAVTIEDFIKCFEDVSKRDLTQFRLWYNQKGTPVLTVYEEFNNGTYTLNFKQDQTPAVVLPIQTGFLDASGNKLELSHPDLKTNSDGDLIYELSQPEGKLDFKNLKQKPVASLLRQFSAPVYLQFPRPLSEHVLLAAKDHDGFNRRESFTELVRQSVLGGTFDDVAKAFELVLTDKSITSLLKATIIKIPNFDEIVQREKILNVPVLAERYNQLFAHLGKNFESQLMSLYKSSIGLNKMGYSTKLIGDRNLKNRALDYLSFLTTKNSEVLTMAQDQLDNSTGLSDVLAALQYVLRQDVDQEALKNKLLTKYIDSALVLQKIYAAFASQPSDKAFDQINKIISQNNFDVKNPNNIYSTLRVLGLNTPIFHKGDAKIYEFYIDWVSKIDELNPQVSARLMGAFNIVKQLDEKNKSQIKSELQKLLAKNPSPNLRELSETVYGTSCS